MGRSTTQGWWATRLSTVGRSLRRAFRRLFQQPSSEFSAPLESRDPICHFLFSRNDFSPLNARVRGRALEPSPQDGKLSVTQTRGLDEPGIWRHAAEYVQGAREPARARADFQVEWARRLGLVVEPDEPPPRHALVTQWPVEKSERMSVAQQLAAGVTLVLAPAN
jgi:hypothetical protein